MRVERLVLLYAALFACPSSAAAVSYENHDRLALRQYPSGNDTTSTTTSLSQTSLSSTSVEDHGPPRASSHTVTSDSPVSTTLTTQTSLTEPPSSTESLNSTSSSVDTQSIPLSRRISSRTRVTTTPGGPITIYPSAPGPVPAPSGPTYGPHPSAPASSESCIPLAVNVVFTAYSIVYTSTVTFMGNRTAYTAPYAALQVPNYCNPTGGETGGTNHGHSSSSRKKQPTHLPDTLQSTAAKTTTVQTHDVPVFSASRTTVTFVTTDKNPTVVYPSDPVPTYDDVGGPMGSAGNHKTAAGNGDSPGNDTPNRPRPTFTVTAGRSQVVINHSTFSDLKPGKTSVVTVGDGTFTIDPTAVVGEGVTVAKPEPEAATVGPPAPTSTFIGGLPVAASGSEAVVGGTTFTIPPDGTATIIDGKSVSAGPGGIAVGDATLTFEEAPPAQTDVVVVGGELLTAIGSSIVVLHSTTITYGSGIPGTTEVVDDDTISIGPSGVVVHGATVGGPDAKATDTEYEIVGGVTITEVGASLLVISGTTFTVGPSAHHTTTVIGGQTLTIGPGGVSAATMTLKFPFGSVVTTIKPSGTWADDLPVETESPAINSGGGDGGDGDDGESAGTLLRPSFGMSLAGLCITIGVWVFI